MLSPDGALLQDDPYAAARRSAEVLRARGIGDHDVLVVLGSGWQRLLETWGEPRAAVPMAKVPGFPVPTADGHGTDVRSYHVGARRVLLLLGRTHLYEGLGTASVAHGVRTAAALGCTTAILTNANGSFRSDWPPGTPMVVADHLNLTATSPLLGPRFVDLTDAYSPALRALARTAHPGFAEGVYAMLPGPHYETAAEGQLLKRLGADVVGMSMVLETIAARELGLSVLGLSMVTVTEGDPSGIDPADVIEVAATAASHLGGTVIDIIRQWEGPHEHS